MYFGEKRGSHCSEQAHLRQAGDCENCIIITAGAGKAGSRCSVPYCWLWSDIAVLSQEREREFTWE